VSQERRNAVHRKRRIILNDDSEMHFEGSDSPEGLIGQRLAHILDTQVDSVFWSFIFGAEQYLYDCQVHEPAGAQFYPGIPKSDRTRHELMAHNMRSLREHGTDPLKVVLDFCHAHGREMFASFRMNMIQDSWRPDFNLRWKREHPDCCLAKRGNGTFAAPDDLRKLYWSAFDFEQPAVRAQRLGLIDDICSRYDVDGMELDFWRWPLFFKPSLDGRPVDPAHVAMMTDFVRCARRRMGQIEAQRQRPLLLAPRVFDTPDICLRMGLDVPGWLAEGLIDILVVGGHYSQFAIPMEQWVALAHAHDVPVYGCFYRSRGIEQDRALAAHYHRSGVDGIYTFNMFNFPKETPTFSEVGDPALIARRDKHYVMPGRCEDFGTSHTCAVGPLPLPLARNVPRTAPLVLDDDVQRAADEGPLSEIRMQVSLRHFDPRHDEADFRINHRRIVGRFKQYAEEVGVLEFVLFTRYTDVPVAPPVVVGQNTLEVTLGPQRSTAERPVEIVGVQTWVRYE